MARPHIEPFCDRDEAFKNMRLPGFAAGMRYKMLSFDVDSGACSMTGGYVYRGCRITNLQGHYFWGDFCDGRVNSFLISGGVPTARADWTASVDPAPRVGRKDRDANPRQLSVQCDVQGSRISFAHGQGRAGPHPLQRRGVSRHRAHR